MAKTLLVVAIFCATFVVALGEGEKQIKCYDCGSQNKSTCTSDFNNVGTCNGAKCFTKIEGESTIIRGCGDGGDNCPGEGCEVCSEEKCNKVVPPKQQVQQCHQCTKCNTTEENNVQKCPGILKGTAKCFWKVNSDSIDRGCTTEDNAMCKSPNCTMCDSDKCNNKPWVAPQSLQCIQCSSDSEGTCREKQDKSTAKQCKTLLNLKQSGACYSEAMKNGTFVRGCLYDRFTDPSQCVETFCTRCNDVDGCNSKVIDVPTCLRCNSGSNPDCADKNETRKGVPCGTRVPTGEFRCYMGIIDGKAMRGCLSDLDEPYRTLCKDPLKKTCSICVASDCNKDEISSGAAALTVTGGLLSLAVLLKSFF